MPPFLPPHDYPDRLGVSTVLRMIDTVCTCREKMASNEKHLVLSITQKLEIDHVARHVLWHSEHRTDVQYKRVPNQSKHRGRKTLVFQKEAGMLYKMKVIKRCAVENQQHD